MNGTSGTALTPNANNSQLRKSWPPPGYEAWAARYPTHWGPLGGGGNSDGAFIVNSYKTTVRNSYFHDTGLISFFEGGTGSGLIFENNVLDLARMAYTDSGLQPNVLVSYCGSPTSCGGLEGRLALSIAARHSRGPEEGSIVRNNVFKNVYANALRVGWFENTPGEMNAAVAPTTPNMIVNNTFHIKGDVLVRERRLLPARHLDRQGLGVGGRQGDCKNNIFLRDTPSTHSVPMFQYPDVAASHTDMDYNNWGGQNVIWKVENTAYTTFPSFQSRMQTYAAGNESHSLYNSPQFVTPYTDLRLQLTSPSYLAGTDLSSTGWAPFNYDFNRVQRPAGSWSMGAYQDLTGDDRHDDH